MEDSRRQFLKMAAFTGVGMAAAPALTTSLARAEGQSRMKENPQALTAGRWGMVIDTRKFKYASDLDPIIQACDKIHNIPSFENERHEIKWIWKDGFMHVFPSKENHYLAERLENLSFLVLCNHCQNPPCVQACPTKATFQREDGIVMMDYHRCIGCRFCMAACPYGSRSFNFRDPRPAIEEENDDFPTRMRGVVEKCNFCAERLAEGKMPACVEVSEGALVFGDLEDPNSEIRKVLRENYVIQRKQNLGTNPSVYYII